MLSPRIRGRYGPNVDVVPHASGSWYSRVTNPGLGAHGLGRLYARGAWPSEVPVASARAAAAALAEPARAPCHPQGLARGLSIARFPGGATSRA
jgi:hypothetical protein